MEVRRAVLVARSQSAAAGVALGQGEVVGGRVDETGMMGEGSRLWRRMARADGRSIRLCWGWAQQNFSVGSVLDLCWICVGSGVDGVSLGKGL
jgi:hypothetical protein